MEFLELFQLPLHANIIDKPITTVIINGHWFNLALVIKINKQQIRITR